MTRTVRRPWLLGPTLAALAALAAGAPVAAQGWQATQTRDGDAFHATAAPDGAGLVLSCGGPAEDPAGSGPVPTAPGQLVLALDGATLDAPRAAPVDRVALVVDGQVFDLPGPVWSADAQAFLQPLDPADALVTRLRGGVAMQLWFAGDMIAEYGLEGSSAALGDMVAFCEERWQGPRTGAPRSVQRPAGTRPDARVLVTSLSDALRSGIWTPGVVGAIAETACDGSAQLDLRAVAIGQFDGDETADLALDWAGVICADPDRGDAAGAGRCGAGYCAIEVWLSESFDPRRGPEEILGAGLRRLALGPGRDALAVGGTPEACADTPHPDCEFVIRAEAGELVPLRTAPRAPTPDERPQQ